MSPYLAISKGVGVNYRQSSAEQDVVFTSISSDYWLSQNHLDNDVIESIALRCYFRRMERESQNPSTV